uniref:Uncharacterized protein n=1 Tax=Ralstonia solanacearum TaxID=305 RepID=A0A0S4V6T0_RALSL|nr:protein of unknown function [Ralstonia solanacearum]CUV29817.1 protein of unknown function [Ralstonia solanacearum]
MDGPSARPRYVTLRKPFGGPQIQCRRGLAAASRGSGTSVQTPMFCDAAAVDNHSLYKKTAGDSWESWRRTSFSRRADSPRPSRASPPCPTSTSACGAVPSTP